MYELNNDSDTNNYNGDMEETDDNFDSQLEAASAESRKRNQFWKDLFRIDSNMLPYTMFYILFPAGFTEIVTFLPIQMKQLGLSASRIGIASAARPFASVFAIAFIMPMSSKLGMRRGSMLVLLVVMMIVGIALATIRSPDKVPCDVVHERIGQLYKDNDIAQMNTSIISSEDLQLDNACCFGVDKVLFRRDVPQITNESVEFGGATDNQYPLSVLSADRSWQYNSEDLLHMFIIFAVTSSAFEMALLPTYACADAAVMVNLKQCGRNLADYGQLRCLGNMTYGIGAFLVGILLQFSRTNIVQCGVPLVNANYRLVAIPFCILMLCTFACVTRFRFTYKENEPETDWTHLKILLTPHYILLLTIILFFGVCNGAVWGFLLWHVENLGATHGLLSVVILFQASLEIPSGYLSSVFIKRLGYWSTLRIGFLAYIVRFGLLYIIRNPWWILPIEALNGIAFNFTWNVLISYLSISVPEQFFVTVSGLCTSLYFCIGVGVGYLFTGYLVEVVGGSATFGYYAITSLVLAFVFTGVMMVVDEPENNVSDGGSVNETSKSPHRTTKKDTQEFDVLLPSCPVTLTNANPQLPFID